MTDSVKEQKALVVSKAREGPPPRPERIKPPKPERKPKPLPEVPMLLNITLTSAQLILVFVGFITALVAYLAEVEIWLVVVRAGLAMLIVGLLLWFANWLLARTALDYALTELKKEIEKEIEKGSMDSTIERQA